MSARFPAPRQLFFRDMAGANGKPGRVDWDAALLEHRRWLRTVVLARVPDAHAADEVLQEVALAAVRSNERFADPGGIPAWLYRVTVRQALLYRRRNSRYGKRLTDYARQSAGSENGAGDPLQWLLGEERMRLVREALVKLPRRDREVLLLKDTENWSYRQMAEHLGISHSAVEARLHRARKRLRHELTQNDVIEVRQ